MATIGKVSAVFTASTSGLTSGVSRAASSMRQLESSVGSLRGSMQTLVAIQGAQLFGSITSGVSSAVSSLVRMGQAQAEVIDSTSKMAARLGMTYGDFSGLALAGNLAGVSMDSIGAAATKADVAFVKAANGSKEATAAFERIGLSVEQLNGMSASERFDAIAQSLAAIPNEAERSAAAVALFGRSGAELLPLFADGAAGIARAREEAERFGLALTTAQGKDVEAMNDAFTRAQAAIQGVVQQVVAYLAPAVKAVTDTFTNLIGSIGGANIGQAIGDGILEGARYLAQVADYFIGDGTKLWAYVSQVGQQFNAVWGFAQKVAAFFSGVANVLEAAFKGVGSVLTSVVGRLLNAIGELAAKVPGFGDFGKGIEAAGEDLMRRSKAMWSEAGQAGKDAANNFAQAFGMTKMEEAGNAIAGPWTRAFDAARAQSEASAAAVEEASRNPIEIRQEAVVQVQGIKEAIQGADVRSSEGVKQMFDVMRNQQNKAIEEQNARNLQRIADNTEGAGDMEFDVADLAAAAGG